ncbi:MAG: cadherin-like domain-containing protein [Candidatus Thermoplasmatota archaeon]|nr:cadherin-like domain-containing protein [Candidatus Thermoplasmatota archaeon]
MNERAPDTLSIVILMFLLILSFAVYPVCDEVDIKASGMTDVARSERPLGYLIITTNELAPSFEPLRGWRSQVGLRAEIHMLGEIQDGPGRDAAEKLFNHITKVHLDSGGSLEYLLLGGDAELIPTRYLHANASKFELDDQYLSDVYYSSPGFDWDPDGDGVFGEREDIEAAGIQNLSFPLKVGRAPVSNVEEANRFVQRTIDYERSPPDGDWFDRGILSSSLMDTPNRIDDPLTPIDEGYNAYKDNGYKAIENYTLSYIPRSLDIVYAHDHARYEGGCYTGDNDTLKAGTLPALLSNGSSFFTFAGQSFYDVEYPVSPLLAYSLAHWFDDSGTATPPSLGFQPALTYRDTYNLTNGGMLPVVYISSCDSANFSDPGDRDLENLLYAPGGGAVCLIGSTGISWRGEGEDYSLGNWYLISRFWQNCMSTNRPGDSLYALKKQYIDQKWTEIASKEPILAGIYTYNYLGDPALRSWIGKPGELRVHAPNLEIYAGGDVFELEVTDPLGTPVAEATVSIYMEGTGEIFTSSTGPGGVSETRATFTEGGTAMVTVTRKNYIPNVLNITVLDEPANVRIDPLSIEYTPALPTEGAPLNVTATITNPGGRDIEGLIVVLLSESLDDLRGELPEILDQVEIDIGQGADAEVIFGTMPMRSWKRLWVAALPPDDEVNLEDNIASIPIDVNARPRFLPFPYLELIEDPEEPVVFDLEPSVFDPDEDILDFSLIENVHGWITLNSNGTLVVDPPENFSGIVSINVEVSDGLASDSTTFELLISSCNDAPAIMDIRSNYRAYVDSTFSLHLELFDAEGDEISIEIKGAPDQFRLVGSTIRFVPYIEDVGNYTITLVLTDPMGANRSYRFVLEIAASMQRLYFTEPSLHLPRATVGKGYTHQIGIGGDLAEGAAFNSNSSIFPIDSTTGELRFTPKSEHTGEHWIRITVTNGDVSITRSFVLQVVEQEGIHPGIYWGLGAGMVILVAIVIGLYLWSGPAVEQYGLEE